MRLTVLESPFSGDVATNLRYARAALRDSLMRNEAPLASHLTYTQPGVLDDSSPVERELGMQAGWEWIPQAEAVVVYTDRGITRGMQSGINVAHEFGVPVEYRSLEGWSD